MHFQYIRGDVQFLQSLHCDDPNYHHAWNVLFSICSWPVKFRAIKKRIFTNSIPGRATCRCGRRHHFCLPAGMQFPTWPVLLLWWTNYANKLSFADLLYESKWRRLPDRLQKLFIMMIANAQRPLNYHGFGLAFLNLYTFGAVSIPSVYNVITWSMLHNFSLFNLFTQTLRTVVSYYIAFKTLAEWMSNWKSSGLNSTDRTSDKFLFWVIFCVGFVMAHYSDSPSWVCIQLKNE